MLNEPMVKVAVFLLAQLVAAFIFIYIYGHTRR